MDTIKGLWLFMVGLLADDMLSMVFRKFRLWKDTIWADGYTKGHDDTQNHFNEMQRMETPMAAQPTQEYQEGYKMGASVGYSHGLTEPRNPVGEDMNIAAKHYEDGYKTGYNTGISDAENKNGGRMDLLNQDIIQWAMRTFPAQTSETIAKHLLREAMDLYHNVQHNEDAGMAPMNNDEDIADIYILLITLAAECDIDLYYAVDNKNNINKGRQWVYLPDKGYHVHSNSTDILQRNADAAAPEWG